MTLKRSACYFGTWERRISKFLSCDYYTCIMMWTKVISEMSPGKCEEILSAAKVAGKAEGNLNFARARWRSLIRAAPQA